MLDVVFMGTAPFGFPVLRTLNDRDDVEVRGVFSQPDRKRGRGQDVQSPPVAEYGRELGLPLYQPEDINEDGLEMLRDLGKIDIAFLVAYGQFLDPDVFEYPTHGTYNFHASLLPRWRGAAPIRHTLLAGDEETGVSIFKLREGMDTGPVCRKVRTTVKEDETYGELYERLSELNVGALNLFIEELKNGELQCDPQDGDPTYAPLIGSEDARIDWACSSEEVERQVRAFCPDPGAFGTINDTRIKIFRGKIQDKSTGEHEPGEIVEIGGETLRVATGDVSYSILELQPAGSSRMDVADFLAGQPDIDVGDCFSLPGETG